MLENIEGEIEKIKERNNRVELDKAWELSLFRKVIIATLTYFTIVLFFIFAGTQKPFLNAIVPTIGFILSGLSLGFFKKIWLSYFYKVKK